MCEEKWKNLELKKHINTIHCSNNISLIQRKIFNALLFNAYHELHERSVFSIQLKKLCLMIGYNSHDYEKVKKSLVELMSLVIEWNVFDNNSSKNNEKWKASSILSAAQIEKGICVYEYSSVMRELLYRPEFYGKICLVTQAKFKSSYGLALYENCVRYIGIPQTPWFSIANFRKLMGVSEEKYPIYKDFKKRVIDIAVNEVNEHSSILISIEVKKERRSVSEIRFKINKKTGISPISYSNDIDHVVKTLTEVFKLTKSCIEEIQNQYNERYISEKIDLIMSSSSYKNGKINDLSSYFLDAIRKNYQYSVNAKHTESLPSKEEGTFKHNEREIDRHRVKYNEYLLAQLDSFFSSLTKKERDSLVKSFIDEKNLVNDWIVLKEFEKSGLEPTIVKPSLAMFLVKKRINSKIFMTIEDYLSLLGEKVKS